MTKWSQLSEDGHQLIEDGHEFTRAVHLLVALRHHQGNGAVKRAVDEASRMQLRFCELCCDEQAFDDGVCIGCRHIIRY